MSAKHTVIRTPDGRPLLVVPVTLTWDDVRKIITGNPNRCSDVRSDVALTQWRARP